MTEGLIGKKIVAVTRSRPWIILHGELVAAEGDVVEIKDARCAVYYSTRTLGVLGLASDGPAKGSRISRRVDTAILCEVELILPSTPEASARWAEEEWS